MARGVPGFVRIGAALAGCALVAACTPDPGPPQTPTPSSAPVTSTSPSPSVSPTPSVTPTETEIERRQRLDWEAAEQSYRTSIAELSRLAQQGETRATSSLRKVSGGFYLEAQLASLKEIKANRWTLRGKIKILHVTRVGGYKRTELSLRSCEDNSDIRLFNQEGRDVTPKDAPDYVQDLTVTKQADRWKVVDINSRAITNISRADCDAG